MMAHGTHRRTRKRTRFLLVLCLSVCSVGTSFADTHYVSLTGTHSSPFTNWYTAATMLVAGIDAAVGGETVWVTNGVYAGGARPAGGMPCRAPLDRPITLRSVNGPEVTFIVGEADPVTTNGAGAMRCVWMTNGAYLVGFTITNGHTRSGGGLETMRSGGGIWSLADHVAVSNCVITGCTAAQLGGGVYVAATSGNHLDHCVLIGNRAVCGGGAAQASMINCTVAANVADEGGGVWFTSPGSRTLFNCSIAGNSARLRGGGTGGSRTAWLTGCVLYFNSAPTAENYDNAVFWYSCSTPFPSGPGNTVAEPLVASVSNPRLLPGSPCIDTGTNQDWMAGGTDLDGEPRTNGTADIGSDEYWPANLTGTLAVAISATYTQAAAGFAMPFDTVISGKPQRYTWDFGDGSGATNQCRLTHAYASTGTYPVTLFVTNLSGSAAATVTVQVIEAPALFVATNGSDAAAGTNWATAKQTVQAGVDAASMPGCIVWVSNGMYNTGGRMALGLLPTNRLVIDKPVTIRSLNGPSVTFIQGRADPVTTNGDAAIRGAYLTPGAALVGFTITNGHTRATYTVLIWEDSGGGVLCESEDATVSNCVLTGNSAMHGGGGCGGMFANCTFKGNTAANGGGVEEGRAINCWLLENLGTVSGGGAHGSSLYGCMLCGNRAAQGGGAMSCSLNNCTAVKNLAGTGGGAAYSYATNSILFYNNSETVDGGPNFQAGSFWRCCIQPLPFVGFGNFTNEPQIVSAVSSNLFLLGGSPCIDAGSNQAWMAGAADIEGDPWLGGAPDVGADEYATARLTGSVSVVVSVTYTQATPGFSLPFVALISGRPVNYTWDFGDGVRFTNRCFIEHAYSATGLYPVVLAATNLSGGTAATVSVLIVTTPEIFVRTNGSDAAAGTNWATAKANIQTGVDAATIPGSIVWVSNGTYGVGGRVAQGLLSNRVAISLPIMLRSLNGPSNTVILGRSDPVTGSNGNAAVRGVWLCHKGQLAGFTITNGHTLSAGEMETERSGGGVWCESPDSVVSNCILTGSTADYFGGGSYGGTLHGCTLAGNKALEGGGAEASALYYCTVSGNSSAGYGGGARLASLCGCTVIGNAVGPSGSGGAVYNCMARNCVIVSNVAGAAGAGAYNSTLYNSLVAYNRSGSGGAAGMDCAFDNCTVVGNAATNTAYGAVLRGKLQSCIVYGNTATNGEANWYDLDSNSLYSCTAPLPPGSGHITNDPQFVNAAAGNFRVQAFSPCIDAGANITQDPYVTDLDGNPRFFNGKVDMGCYEFTMNTTLKAFLQGPYNTNTALMATNLFSQGFVPLTSPYSADARSASNIPPAAVDWVLVQLVETAKYESVAAKSYFLREDGYVMNDSGTNALRLETSPGYYYVTIKHRNHLAAMSANPIAYTNTVVTYDLTTGSAQYYGGTNACVQIDSNAWGMIAGDADGDGKITAVDKVICSNQLGQTGYKAGDFNLDGVVNE